jgi:uncharacterized protein (DUF885 family)
MRIGSFCIPAVMIFALPLTEAAVSQTREPFDLFTQRAAEEWVRGDPQQATTIQYFSGSEQDALDRRLIASHHGLPIEPAARQARVAQAKKILVQLAAYDRAQLTPTQRISAAVIESNLGNLVEAAPLADHWFVFEQFYGLHTTLVNFLSQEHPIRNRRDVENYLERLRQVPPLIDLGISEARAQARKGILMPRFILSAVLGQLNRFIEPGPGKNVLVGSLAERAATVKDLSAVDRAALVAEAEQVVRTSVMPAYVRLRELIASQVPQAKDDAGLWRLPRGAAAYAVALRGSTTTDLTADEIHSIGSSEVKRIEAQMDQLLRELGYSEGSLQARYDKLNDSVIPPAEPDPRPALIAEYTGILRDAERRAATLFDLRPKAPVEVRREPPFTERNAAAHYTGAAPDGTRPGIFWAPLPDPRTKNISTGLARRTVTYHEAVPGHHFQNALQQELTEIPRFRRFGVFGRSDAFGEGWGLYAEKIAAEAGWYEGDPQGRLGQLYLELYRARRLVVDTGLHAKHWTRQQAIDYGMPVNEVERYVVLPGQACAYKIGELEILRLRTKAQQALGTRFSMKEFHNVVLRVGNVPLSVLAQVVDDYIRSASKGVKP